MAKLTLLALAFTALVAFATAHTTIVTTTVEDDNQFPIPSFIPPIPGVTGPMCRQSEQLDKCRMYLQQGQSPYELNRGQSQQGQVQGGQLQQQCCQQLQNVERRCQCEAVKQLFEDAQQTQGQQQGQFGSQQQLEQKAQNLPQQCRLQISQEECQIRRGGSSGSQQCSRIQGQHFNQCQRFIQQAQQQSGSPRLMMFSQQSQQLQQQLRQCCNELENVQRDCQCEALEEVYKQAIQQQEGGQQQQQPWQQGGQQQPWQQGGQQQPWQQEQHQPWQQPQRQQGSQQIGRAIDTIGNQCNLQVQQCRIPSAMF